MQLCIWINKVTKKPKWNIDRCIECNYRFGCLSGNEIFIEPDSMVENNRDFTVVFSVPRCVRIGLLKQMCDNWFLSNFEHARLTDTKYSVNQVTVKLKPPTLILSGNRW